MKNVQSAFSKPVYTDIPKSSNKYLLNNRVLRVSSVFVDNQYFPNKGTFSKAIIHFEHHVEIQVNQNVLVFAQNKKQVWSVTPKSVDIFLERINAQNVFVSSSSRTYGPMYHSILHIVSDDLDFYASVPGAKLGRYLLDHSEGLTVHDPTGLMRIPYLSDEYALTKSINKFGYHQLVEGTDLVFLDNDKASNINWE